MFDYLFNRQDPLKGKRVGILGFARQGQALARWLPTIGAHPVVSDGKTAAQLGLDVSAYPNVEFMLGVGDDVDFLHNVDLLCVSGGVPLTNQIVVDAFMRGIPLANDAQLFLERCPAPVIGITGSSGKTTTATLTSEIVRAAGYKTWLGGNIGNVLLDDLTEISPHDCVVMELSSFQLELMTISPFVATILNARPNHLDRHVTMEAYLDAKLNILRHQSPEDVAVIHWGDLYHETILKAVVGAPSYFSMTELLMNGASLSDDWVMISGAPNGGNTVPTRVLKREDVKLRGSHNLQNVLAACVLSGTFGAPITAMQDVIPKFRGVSHRQEVVRQFNGVTWVNDSIATTPDRVVAALNSYDESIILLLGGRDKQMLWEPMLRLAMKKARHIIVFGELTAIVEPAYAKFVEADAPPLTCVETLDVAVAKALGVAREGDVVLLSPGGTSYDLYVDFAARGEHFRQLVKAL